MPDTGLKQNYAGVFDGRLTFGDRPALLLIDLACAYLEPDSPLYGPSFPAALEVNKGLVEAARSAGLPVIFTRVEYQRGGADGGLFFRKVPALRAFQRGDRLGAFPASLTPQPSETVITKQYASAFFGTSLASTLTAARVDCLLVTGFSTSGCVRATALDTLQHGFAPFVVKDACADRHPGPHEANLFDLQAKYAEVIGSAEALRLIATHQRVN